MRKKKELIINIFVKADNNLVNLHLIIVNVKKNVVDVEKNLPTASRDITYETIQM